MNRRRHIAFDPTFAETVNLTGKYHVFVQAYGDAELYVTNRTARGFDVVVRDGDPGVEFSYRVVAKRRGFEGKRLERAECSQGASALFLHRPHFIQPLTQAMPDIFRLAERLSGLIDDSLTADRAAAVRAIAGAKAAEAYRRSFVVAVLSELSDLERASLTATPEGQRLLADIALEGQTRK